MSDIAVPDLMPPDPNPRAPHFAMPAEACDCHAHVFGPRSRYAYYSRRIYTPADCPLPDYLALLDRLGVARAVLVQPSPYGTDNSALLDAIAGRDNFRGIVVLPPEGADHATLEAMHEAGVRGVRYNIVDTFDDKGKFPVERIAAVGERIRPFGWHIEMLAHVNEFPDLDRILERIPVPVSFGHLGYVPTRLGVADAGFQALLRAMRSRKAWVKLTAPYRISATDLPHLDVTDFARALLDAAPDRVVWGSDWPHGKAEWPIPMPNDGDLADLLLAWCPDADVRHRILVDNPAELYGF